MLHHTPITPKDQHRSNLPRYEALEGRGFPSVTYQIYEKAILELIVSEIVLPPFYISEIAMYHVTFTSNPMLPKDAHAAW